MMSICFTWFLIWFSRTLHIPEFGEFYKNWGILLGSFGRGSKIVSHFETYNSHTIQVGWFNTILQRIL